MQKVRAQSALPLLLDALPKCAAVVEGGVRTYVVVACLLEHHLYAMSPPCQTQAGPFFLPTYPLTYNSTEFIFEVVCTLTLLRYFVFVHPWAGDFDS